MIASVRGTVAAVSADGAVIELGGFGLAVSCSPGTLARLRVGDEARLATSLVVREDSLTLYGFADDDERALFELLQTANGVGPKLAQTILGVHSPREVRRAIATNDLTALIKVPGIGRKGAERIVLELRDRIGSIDGGSDAPLSGLGVAAVAPWRDQLTHALAGLGFSAKESADTVDVLANELAESGDAADLAALLRRSIYLLGRARDDRPSADEIVSALPIADEREVEASLRPKRLSEFVGQPKVREQLELVLESARRRGRSPDHVLLSGPPGLGKTSLSMIIAAELGQPIRITSGPAIERAGDLAALLTSLTEGEVLFIDEIHRIARPAEELLYMAMEDFRVDIIVGKGAGATAIPLELEPFTLIGATTRAGLLTGPLRDRFGFTGHMEFYEPDELELVLARSATLLGVDLRDDGAAEIASRSRGTPRIANRLLRRVRDYAEVRADGIVNEQVARDALAVYDVDQLGLDRLDRAVLDALIRRFGGGPVGIGTIAVAVGEEVETVEEVAEPFLVRAGLLVRTPAGTGGNARGLAPPGPDATRHRDRSARPHPVRREARFAFTAWGAYSGVFIRCFVRYSVELPTFDHPRGRLAGRHRVEPAPSGPGDAQPERGAGSDPLRHRGADDVGPLRHGRRAQRRRHRPARDRSRGRGQVGPGGATRRRIAAEATERRADSAGRIRRITRIRRQFRHLTCDSVVISRISRALTAPRERSLGCPSYWRARNAL